MFRTDRLPLSLVAAVACLAIAASTVSANNFGSNITVGGTAAHACDTSIYSQCVNNNNSNLVKFDNNGLDQTHIDAMTYAMNDYNAISGAPVYMYVSTLADSLVDVIAQDVTVVGNGAWAWTACSTTATYGGTDPRRWCYPQRLKWNLAYASNYSTTTAKRDVACHELGHSMGLRHSNESSGSCMINGSTAYTTTSTHDRSMLTGNY